uniref:Uncharacterized protein n=1 Tax=Arundo donax TaxID=35708 RepID=A0A0A9BMR5_ARUDO
MNAPSLEATQPDEMWTQTPSSKAGTYRWRNILQFHSIYVESLVKD